MAKTPREAPAGQTDQPQEQQNEQSQEQQQQNLPLSEQITYLPREGDPAKTKWRGIVFHANVPKTISDPEHIEAARAHPFFKVGEFDPAKDSTETTDEGKGQPKNQTEYRAHVVAWLKKTNDINQFVANWKNDAALQQFCEVGTADYEYLGTLLRPKMHELAVAANLNEVQLGKLWARNGVYQLPF